MSSQLKPLRTLLIKLGQIVLADMIRTEQDRMSELPRRDKSHQTKALLADLKHSIDKCYCEASDDKKDAFGVILEIMSHSKGQSASLNVLIKVLNIVMPDTEKDKYIHDLTRRLMLVKLPSEFVSKNMNDFKEENDTS